MLSKFTPEVETLEDRSNPSQIFEGQAAIALGSGTGAPGTLTFLADNGAINPWKPFGNAYSGGFRVKTADVNNDGYKDLIAATGPGVPGTVLIYDGQELTRQTDSAVPQNPSSALLLAFQPYGPNYMAGVFVGASAGRIVTGTDTGALPQVNVYDTLRAAAYNPSPSPDRASAVFDMGLRLRQLSAFFAYPQGYFGGVRVGSLPGEVLTAPGVGGSPYVGFWTEQGKPIRSVAAFGAATPLNYTGGLNLTTLDEEPTPFPGHPIQEKGAHPQLWAVSAERDGSLVGLWDESGNVHAFQVHPFPFGTRVGLTLQYVPHIRQTEAVLYVAFANVPNYVRYRCADLLAGFASPYFGGIVPPGIIPGNSPTGFVSPMGGWVG